MAAVKATYFCLKLTNGWKEKHNCIFFFLKDLIHRRGKIGSGSSSCKISHEWLAALRVNNRTNKNNAPSPKICSNYYTGGLEELQAYESCYMYDKILPFNSIRDVWRLVRIICGDTKT